MGYTLPKGYLSASSIGTLLNCPKQFEFRYIYDIIIPPSAALVTGSTMHRTLETYWRDVIAGGERLTGSQTAELSVSILDTVLQEDDVKMSGTEKDEAIDDLQKISKNYIDHVAVDITPLAVEEEVRYTAKCGVDVLGYVDLRRQLQNDQGLCDYKITGRKWTIDKLRNSLQFNLYAMMTGIGDIEVHNMLKTVKVPKILPKKPEEDGVKDITSNIRVLHNVFDGSQIDHVETMIESAAKLITSGIFMPCAMDSWCCNDQWCGYWHLCRGKKS